MASASRTLACRASVLRERLAKHVLAQVQAFDLGDVLAPVAFAETQHHHVVESVDGGESELTPQGLHEVHGLAGQLALRPPATCRR